MLGEVNVLKGFMTSFTYTSKFVYFSFHFFEEYVYIYTETWELGTPKGLWKTVLNSEVILFLRSISVYWIGIATEVAVPNSQVVPISQVVLKTGFTV